MSMIEQIGGKFFTAAYEPKTKDAKESDAKKDAKIKDSVALSGKGRTDSSDDKSSAVLKKMVEDREDSRKDLVLRIRTQIGSQGYSFEERIDAVSSNIIYSMFA